LSPAATGIEVPMPRLSDSMEEGTIVRWLFADGDAVEVGQEIAEIETDKATMPLEAEAAGPLRILAQENETLPVGAPIAWIGEGPSAATAGPVAAGDPPAPAVAKASSNGRVKASPLARRLAAERGLDLSKLGGSGPGGRIVKADVEAAAVVPAPAPAVEAPAAVPETAKGNVTYIELSRLQQVVTRRMAESKATAPDFALTRELDMEAAVELRGQLKKWAGEGEPVPSYNDLVVKACALALKEHPRANGAYRDGRWELYERVNVGIAVAGEDGALIVPVVPDVDRASLGEIARTSKRLALAARDGSVTPPELAGGTFTVSNLGMFGIDTFTAVINPPQAAILAVGALAQKPVVVDGELAVGWRMGVTLVCDHRILSGADGAAFLARVAELLASPGALVL
jgi:pyruvate dehydrogenase E2 component (dihydrolipoamide acetyltransferase)